MMVSYRSSCYRCGIPIGFMTPPDQSVPHYCAPCVPLEEAAAKLEKEEFEEAKKQLREKKSLGQENRQKMRDARGTRAVR